MIDPLPVSDASERNKAPILAVLRRHLGAGLSVLEIGAGTGQHAEHFGRALPRLRWQASELPGALPGLGRRLAGAGLPNVPAPLALDVAAADWALPGSPDAVFSANTAHIMPWPAVEALFEGAARELARPGLLLVYGPFRYGGRHTGPGNARFDATLRRRDPAMGIRDFEALEGLARAHGMTLLADHHMPADNHTLVWRVG